ncbi:MAG: UbiA family prenyltransferase [Sphingomonas sp.]|uniref:UbiA family prenyltransferase n=1 Tax=Sphingomonas sp. TaxID=28214 RepID=UPI0025E1E328|nr:UbiA family prenyltransferase [Sphingomonas sp.]MBX9880754.1 UbiA family prenyltransferase [Sphingomonas sp.]
MNLHAPIATTRPLYVDLDRTLTPADVSLESFVRFARRGLWPALLLVWWLLRGRAVAKAMVARACPVDPARLPYRAEVLALIAEARAQGRRVVLASGSHQRNVARIARHLGLFDAVAGASARVNLKGRRKLAWIVADAAGPFDYLGDAPADRPIWQAATGALSVDHAPAGVRRIAPRPRPARALVKAMRPHQWAKNALVFVPLATSGLWSDPALIVRAVGAFLFFSLAASGVYLVNDLLDIESDRAHRTKRHRPLASGALPIPHAILAAALLLVASPIAAWGTLGPRFALVLAGYLVLTKAYSLRLKAVVTLDVIVLACLYTLRIFAGAVAIAVPVSSWLLTFSIFLFLSLAYLKRYAELAQPSEDPRRLLGGRGYAPADVEVVMMMGVAAAMTSILVLALFISHVSEVYAHGTPQLLSGLCLILLYWLTRLWTMARRGEVSGDPIAFAITDRRSLALGALAAVLVIVAQRVQLGL